MLLFVFLLLIMPCNLMNNVEIDKELDYTFKRKMKENEEKKKKKEMREKKHKIYLQRKTKYKGIENKTTRGKEEWKKRGKKIIGYTKIQDKIRRNERSKSITDLPPEKNKIQNNIKEEKEKYRRRKKKEKIIWV